MNIKRRLFAAALVVALAVAGILMNGARETAKASPGAAPVSIVSPLPLPTTAAQSGPWNVNVANSPAVSLVGTPTVNANVTFPPNQGVTVAAAGPLTNVGRLPSKQVILRSAPPGQCPSGWFQIATDGAGACFDMGSHPGEVLVITDFSWLATTNPSANCTLIIGTVLIGPTHLLSGAAAGSDGIAVKSEHLTTGITMTVNPFIYSGPFVGGSAACIPQASTITGYLMPNQ